MNEVDTSVGSSIKAEDGLRRLYIYIYIYKQI